MKETEFENVLACPFCKKTLSSKKHTKGCRLSKVTFEKVDGILDFVSMGKKTKSLSEYEKLHQKGSWGRISDGSYEILANFARGNKTLDIACGEGWIEQLAPDTVGLDFSFSALKKAFKNGARHLVWARAENLPFIDNAFDIAINAGSLENIEDPIKSILEMARVSKMQILTVHREFDFPLARELRNLANSILGIKHQPVERPLRWKELEDMLKRANLHLVYKGFWTLPVNFGRVIKFLPTLKDIPSCFFVITIRKNS